MNITTFTIITKQAVHNVQYKSLINEAVTTKPLGNNKKLLLLTRWQQNGRSYHFQDIT